MLADQYEQQMIADDQRDGNDGGHSNFAAIVEQKDEQDYAINTFKGSGMMAEMYKTSGADKKPAAKKVAPAKTVKKVDKAKSLEEMVNGGSAAMYEFSAAIADSSWKDNS